MAQAISEARPPAPSPMQLALQAYRHDMGPPAAAERTPVTHPELAPPPGVAEVPIVTQLSPTKSPRPGAGTVRTTPKEEEGRPSKRQKKPFVPPEPPAELVSVQPVPGQIYWSPLADQSQADVWKFMQDPSRTIGEVNTELSGFLALRKWPRSDTVSSNDFEPL